MHAAIIVTNRCSSSHHESGHGHSGMRMPCVGEVRVTTLQAGEPSSSASADMSLLTGSANYMFFDADEAANQKQQKKKGKGKKE